MYHFLFLMFFHYHHDYGRAIPLEPLLQFGNLSVYHTRTKSCFAGVVCHLQSFFVTEEHSIGTRCQQTLRIMWSLVILKVLLKLILELMFCLCCDLCFCITL